MTTEDFNLLVSIFWRAPGRARREVLSRLRALGDPAPDIAQTVAKGILAVRTTLDPRSVARELRALCERSPQVFRFTLKWVPIDCWTEPDLAAMTAAVAGLRHRIAPGETWRMTVERRAPTSLDPDEIIRTLAALIDARVDLGRPDRVLLVALFGSRVALSVLGGEDVFSVVKVLPKPHLGERGLNIGDAARPPLGEHGGFPPGNEVACGGPS